MIEQRFNRNNVISYLENAVRDEENTCNVEEVREDLARLNSGKDAENFMEDLINKRKSINRKQILCEKLKKM